MDRPSCFIEVKTYADLTTYANLMAAAPKQADQIERHDVTQSVYNIWQRPVCRADSTRQSEARRYPSNRYILILCETNNNSEPTREFLPHGHEHGHYPSRF